MVWLSGWDPICWKCTKDLQVRLLEVISSSTMSQTDGEQYCAVIRSNL